MKHHHHTCVVIVGSGRFHIRHMDLFALVGLPIHINGRPWWWGLMLRSVAKG